MRFEIHDYGSYVGIKSVKWNEWMYTNEPKLNDDRRHVLFWGRAGAGPTNDDSMRFKIHDYGSYVGIKSVKWNEWMYTNEPKLNDDRHYALFWCRAGATPINDESMRFEIEVQPAIRKVGIKSVKRNEFMYTNEP